MCIMCMMKPCLKVNFQNVGPQICEALCSSSPVWPDSLNTPKSGQCDHLCEKGACVRVKVITCVSKVRV